MCLLMRDLVDAGDCRGRIVDLLGSEGAEFAGLHVFPAFRHGEAPVEGCESRDEGETDLETPYAVEFAVVAGFQGGAEASEEDEGDDGAKEGSLGWSVVS